MADGFDIKIEFDVLRKQLLDEAAATLAELRKNQTAVNQATRKGLLNPTGLAKTEEQIEEISADMLRLITLQRTLNSTVKQFGGLGNFRRFRESLSAGRDLQGEFTRATNATTIAVARMNRALAVSGRQREIRQEETDPGQIKLRARLRRQEAEAERIFANAVAASNRIEVQRARAAASNRNIRNAGPTSRADAISNIIDPRTISQLEDAVGLIEKLRRLQREASVDNTGVARRAALSRAQERFPDPRRSSGSDVLQRIIDPRTTEQMRDAVGLARRLSIEEENANRQRILATERELETRRLLRAAQAEGVRLNNQLGEAGGGAGDRIRRGIDGAAGGFRRFNTIANTVSRTLISVGSLAAVFSAIEGVRQGVLFGDEFERAEAQIAGIIASTGRLIDAQGGVLRPAEAFGVALGIARDQQRKLQIDALSTTATYRELLQAFQVSIGPGLASNLGLDEIRELTVGISQAATAVGLPLNQLAEEIRSIFSGAIDRRNTRLATILGIDNADIQLAKEAGTLFEFLQGKLEGITTAAKALNTTFGQAFSNAIDALSIAGAAALDPFRDSLIGLARLLQEGLQSGAVNEALGGIGRALATVTDNLVNFVSNLDAGSVSDFATIVDDLASILSESLVAALSTVATLFGVIATVIAPVISVLESLVDTKFGEALLQAAATVLILRAAFRLISVDALRAAAANAILALGLIQTGGAATFAAVALRGLLATLGPIGLAIAGLSLLFTLFGDSTEDAAGAAAEELERLRAEATKLERGGQLTPLIEGAQEFEKAVNDAADKIEKLAGEIQTLGQQEGLSKLVAGLVGAVGDIRVSFDFTAANAQIAALDNEIQELISARDRREESFGPDNLGALTRNKEDKAAEIAAVQRLADLERQRLDVLDQRRAAEIQIAGIEAQRIAQQTNAGLVDLRDELLLEQAIAEAKSTATQNDDDQLDIIERRVDLAKLEREFQNDIAELDAQQFKAIAQGDFTTAFQLEQAVVALEQQFELRKKILETQVAALEAEGKLNEARELRNLLEETGNIVRSVEASESQVDRSKTDLSIARLDPDTTRGQIEINLLLQEDARRELEIQLRLSQDLSLEQEDRNDALSKTIEKEAEILKLKREQQDLKEKTDFGAGFGAGIDQFRENNQPGQIGQRLAGDLVQAPVTFLSDSLFAVVANAFSPNKNQTLSETLKGLSLAFGASLLKAVTDALAAQAVSFLIGPTTAAAQGGRIEALAAGGPSGMVGGPNLASAPIGAPASDRTLAALTPGEFVIRKQTAESLGYDFLHRLNAGRLLNRDFRRMSPSLSRGVQGLAAGGAVEGRASVPGSRRERSGGTTVLPVMVADRESVRTLLRGRGFDESLQSRATLLRSVAAPRE